MDNYIFPCVFIYKDDGISVYFPDLDGCVSFGENETAAYQNAKEALTLHLYGMEQDGDLAPVPTPIKEIALDDNEKALFIEVFMPPFRAKQANKIVKKTLTIPEWLNLLAEKHDVNFSQVLQNALKEYLNVS